MYDLVVIGGGPAGLTATVYAIRKRLNILLVTKDLGGKTNYKLSIPWIDDYQVIRGLEIVNRFRNELEYLDFARRMEQVEKVSITGSGFSVRLRDGDELLTKAVIIATGVRQQRLNVPGEKEFTMRGLCYSAISYAPLFIDHTVAVIGDGDLALRATAELSTIAKKVYLIHKSNGILSTPLGNKITAASNVELLADYDVVCVNGDNFARSVTLKDQFNQPVEVQADAIFVEKGLIPNSQMIAGLVALDPIGRIRVDFAGRTNIPGLFAAGDVTTGYAEQVLVAVGDGAKAALSAYEYLLPQL